MPKQFPLTKGYFAIVDNKYFDEAVKLNWTYVDGYARHAEIVYGKQKMLSLHHFILKVPSHIIVDHKNGNTLDNRESNLRVVTAKQSAQNRKVRSDSTSRYTGLSFANDRQLYRVYICVDGHTIWLGQFKSKRKAIRCRKEAELKYFGEYTAAHRDTRKVKIDNPHQHFIKVIPKNKTGYRGVYYIESAKKYAAQYCYKHQRFSLGRFDNPEDAARARDELEWKYRGKLGNYNFPRK